MFRNYNTGESQNYVGKKVGHGHKYIIHKNKYTRTPALIHQYRKNFDDGDRQV